MHGNLRQVYEVYRENLAIGQIIGWGQINPLMAEIIAGLAPAWYALKIAPVHERIAAAHLAARRFGVFAPEAAALRVKRGRCERALVPMFPGYVFVFTWLGGANYRRIVSCPGVVDFLRRGGIAAVIPDAIIRVVREEENKQQPLIVEQEAIGRFKKVKRGWRRHRSVVEQPVADSEIVSVRTWSAFGDALRTVDSDKRTRLLLSVLGVA